MIFDTREKIKTKNGVKELVREKRKVIPQTKELILGPYFFNVYVKDNGDAGFKVEQLHMLVGYDDARYYTKNDINKMCADYALYACEKMVNFFEATSDEVIQDPKTFNVNYSKVKRQKVGEHALPVIRRAYFPIPEEFEGFKNLVKNCLKDNFKLLKRFHTYYDDTNHVKDITNRMLAIDKAFRASEKEKNEKYWDVWYLQRFPIVNEKDADLTNPT